LDKVIVTGGAGYIGSHTCKALAKERFEPVVFDNLSKGHAESVKWGPFVNGDMLNLEQLDKAFEIYRPTAVVHFAALSNVGESSVDPLAYYRTNVCGLVNVVGSMIKYGVDTIVFSSTCATYGVPDTVPIAEIAPQRPINPYGWSKLTCEHLLIDTAAANKLKFAILRYFNACGADPDGELKEQHDPETHLIPLAVDAAIGQGPPLRVFGLDYPTGDGTCERDYIHVSDLAIAHVGALKHLGEGNSSLTLNLGTGRPYSVLAIISAIERITGLSVPLVKADRRPGDAPVLVADATLAEKVIQFQPKYSDLDAIVYTTWQSRLSPHKS
jgi:UDP-arabinose 4-epimerase